MAALVRFLHKRTRSQKALLSTKVGQKRKMTVTQRVQRPMPHEMTTKLLKKWLTLRLRRTGVSLDIVLNKLIPVIPKDKYSAFAYGLWRIKEA